VCTCIAARSPPIIALVPSYVSLAPALPGAKRHIATWRHLDDEGVFAFRCRLLQIELNPAFKRLSEQSVFVEKVITWRRGLRP